MLLAHVSSHSLLLCIHAERSQLGCLLDAARPDAGCADTNVLAYSVNHRADALQVRVPAAAAGVICVADYVAEVRPFAANFAFLRHDDSSPNLLKLHKDGSLAEFSRFRTLFVCAVVTQSDARSPFELTANGLGRCIRTRLSAGAWAQPDGAASEA